MNEFNDIEELGRPVHMEPHSTRQVLLVEPGRIADLETTIEELHEDVAMEKDAYAGAMTENDRLRGLCEAALSTIEALDQNKLRDRAAYYTMVATTCMRLRAALEPQKGAGDGQ